MNKEELFEKLRKEGFSEAIIRAFTVVDRSSFVLPEYISEAYEDTALPIGFGQTISQPSTIAFMLTLLDPQPQQKILEVGSGSGYVLALLAKMVPAAEIYGTDRIPDLAQRGRAALIGYNQVRVKYTPRQLGWPQEAPFDRILASAAASHLPEELLRQLSPHGILVCPVGHSIIKAVNLPAGVEIEEYPGFVFVKLYQNGIES